MIQYSFLAEDNRNLQFKNLLKNKRIKNAAIGAGVVKALSFSAVNAIVISKISKIRKLIKECNSREEAEKILLNVGYIIDDNGNKDVKIVSINYAVSDAVCGPSLQIVRNETDPLWKKHVLKYLKTVAIITVLKTLGGIAAGAVATKSLLK